MGALAIPELDGPVLKWAGLAGHTYVVVVDDVEKQADGNFAPNGKRRIAYETTNRQGAIRESWAREDLHGSVYQQVAKGKWKKVR